MNTGTREDFIGPRARFLARVLFAFIGLTILFSLIWTRHAIPVDHVQDSADSAKQSAPNVPVLTRENPEPTPAATPAAQTNLPSTAMPASPKEPTKQALVEQHPETVPDEQATFADRENEPDNEPVQNANAKSAATTLPSASSEKKFEIIGGVTAPGYVLVSNDLHQRLARDRRCRFVITDGRISLEIVGELSPDARMRAIGSEWHESFAKRMVPIDSNPVVATLVATAKSRYPLAADTSCFLSVPNELDREIFHAQELALGEAWDVSATTTIDFIRGKAVVTAINTISTPSQTKN